jgi:tetraacyldisaccharide 4'-kinase
VTHFARRVGEAARAGVERRLVRLWFGSPNPYGALLAAALGPLSALVARVAHSRRRRITAAKARDCAALGPRHVPVVIVGNLIVGGTGKTPLLIALVDLLARRGWRPGVIARGYRRSRSAKPLLIQAGDTVAGAGDEPLLVALRTGRPVAVGADRAATLDLLLRQTDCNVVLSDDGLQHVALRRDIELAVFDARGAGNGACLPRGPLREPLSALQSMDAQVLNGRDTEAPLPHPRTFRFEIRPTAVVALDGIRHWTPAAFAAATAGQPVTALAGIGMPGRFFDSLAALGIRAQTVALGDHARIEQAWLEALPGRWLIMTEKDAVKCIGFDGALLSRCVALRIEAVPDDALLDWLEDRLHGQPTA